MIPDNSEVDLVVIGAGAAGMTAALIAALRGLDVLLLEKADVVGGTSAISAGSVWIPNTHLAAPGADSAEQARRYLMATVGDRLRGGITLGPAMTFGYCAAMHAADASPETWKG